jgi:hypothetical protein
LPERAKNPTVKKQPTAPRHYNQINPTNHKNPGSDYLHWLLSRQSIAIRKFPFKSRLFNQINPTNHKNPGSDYLHSAIIPKIHRNQKIPIQIPAV